MASMANVINGEKRNVINISEKLISVNQLAALYQWRKLINVANGNGVAKANGVSVWRLINGVFGVSPKINMASQCRKRGVMA
jgi:hypothetical protein